MKYYTGIGSRQTPKDILKLMEDIAFKLAQKGYILRSGAAEGADSAFERGCDRFYMGAKEVFIPWKDFGGISGQGMRLILEELPTAKEAYQLASETHPAWDKCSKGAKALHARNTFQILGPNLNNPSSFLICWAQVDKHGQLKGGTRTAWELAKANGVPCFNLYNEDDKQRLIKFVESE